MQKIADEQDSLLAELDALAASKGYIIKTIHLKQVGENDADKTTTD